MQNISAGILLYHLTNGNPEVFLVHPGGPFFKNKDKGWWSIPKGLPEEAESLEEAALREFFEETGFKPDGKLIPLGSIKQKAGKLVHCWAVEGAMSGAWELKSNTFSIEWPPRSGRQAEFPEIDKAQFFPCKEALEYINSAQAEFIHRLLAYLGM